MPPVAAITRVITTEWKWATMKYVSWLKKSIGGDASMTPVIPPKRKVTRKPIAMSIGVEKWIGPRPIVPIQLKKLMPVGTEMSNESSEKNGSRTTPVVNM